MKATPLLIALAIVTAATAARAQIGRTIFTSPHAMRALAWSPSDDRLVFGDTDGTLTLWDVDANTLLRSIHVSTGAINFVAWRPGHDEVGYGGGDAIGIWNLQTGAVQVLSGNDSPVRCIAWNPDGKRIACACGGASAKSFRVWNADEQQLLLEVDTASSGSGCDEEIVAWDPGGSTFIAAGTCGYRGTRFDPTTGDELGHLSDQFGDRGFLSPIRSIMYSPDGSEFATGHYAGLINIYDAGTLTIKRQIHRDDVGYANAIAWSPAGALLVSGNGDGVISVWNAGTLLRLNMFKGHSLTVNALSWSPDGTRLATCGEEGAVKIWDAADLPSSVAGPVAGDASIVVAPNPARGQLRVHFAAKHAGRAACSLSDIRGTAVLTAERELHGDTGGEIDIDVAGIPSGVYILAARVRGGSVIRRLVQVMH